ncbi:MAG: chorismate mutase [Spirochaetales bacterium]|nr:chorismate mutase [Candidatus Physcosoma equi]
MEDNSERIYALRGAITADSDTPEAIDQAVGEMLKALYEENGLTEDDICFTLISMTSDLKSKNAAASARKNGFSTKTPIFCVQEAEINGMLPLCVRVLLQVNHPRRQEPVMVYLKGAAKLRPDLKRK